VNFKVKGMRALSAAALLAAVAAIPAQAATVTFQYTQSFGTTPPIGPSPYATAVFDDGGSAGSVTLTMTATSTIGAADITGMYFNLVDDSTATLNGLGFSYVSGPEATNGVGVGTNAYRADGDGYYDILFDYPPPGGPANFSAGDVSVYTITGAGLLASDFNVIGAPGPGAGNPGPFLSVARFQSTGTDGNGSDWVGASPVPVPAAVWLFGSGLLGLVGVARRKKQ